MEFDAVRLDAQINVDQSINYWRDRAECLEEWVCELLRKNQALRMDREKEQSLHPHREETALTFSFHGRHQPPFPSARLTHRNDSAQPAFDAGLESCPRKECTEIRESVIHNAAMKEFSPAVIY